MMKEGEQEKGSFQEKESTSGADGRARRGIRQVNFW